jgi:hypothetical protein
MKVRVIAFLFVFFVLVPVALAQTGGQESPGGTPETPVNGPALKLDTPVSVPLSGTTPVNLTYKTTGNETVSVSARSLESEGVLDPTLSVLDPSGATLASNDDHSGDAAGLTPRDSLIEGLTLTDAGRYIVQVAATDPNASGNVEILVSSGSAAATEAQPSDQTAAQSSSPGTNLSISDTVPPNSPYTTTFQAKEGDVVTITVKATDNQLDPKVSLLDSSGAEVASNDDSTDPSLGPYDSQIPDFTIPKTDTYTISISGFAGIGGTFDLTVVPGGSSVPNTNPTPQPANPTDIPAPTTQVIQGSVKEGDIYTYDLQVNAGDVYTITVQSTTQDFDPVVSIYLDNKYVIDNDDYSSSDPTLQSTDSRIYDWIFQEAGKYEIDVRGYQSKAGSFTLTLDPVATGAPTGLPDEHVELGSVKSGDTYSYNFDAKEGDWVTITVRSLSTGFDPYVSLLSADGTVLLNNDNNGTSADYAYYDALIRNYYISATGKYTIEVTSASDTGGSFGLTIGTVRPG